MGLKEQCYIISSFVRELQIAGVIAIKNDGKLTPIIYLENNEVEKAISFSKRMAQTENVVIAVVTANNAHLFVKETEKPTSAFQFSEN